MGNRLSERGRDLLAWGAVVLAAAVSLLFALGRAPVDIWDEARVAINALEMMHAANPLVVTFHGQPDLLNPKPPLAPWLAALSMRVGGINEVALRLPSAAAAVLTTFIVFGFARSVSRRRSVGVLAALILLGTGGYVGVHVARTADPDSLLVLFVTIATFALWEVADQPATDRSKWLYVAAAALACGMLAKGIATFLMVPGYALAFAATHKLRALLAGRATWLGLAAILVVAVLYWGGREAVQPGYLAAAWQSDVARYGVVLDRHVGPWYYYLLGLVWPWPASLFKGLTDVLYSRSAFPWSVVLLATAPFALTSRELAVRRTSTFLIVSLVGFLAVISASATKLSWYVAPAFPLIAVVTALGISEVADRLRLSSDARLRRSGLILMPAALALSVIMIGFVTWKNVAEAQVAESARDQRLAYFLREVGPHLPKNSKIRVLSDARWTVSTISNGRMAGVERYDGPAEFEVTELKRAGYDIRIVAPVHRAQPDEILIGCGPVLPAAEPSANLVSNGHCFALWPRPQDASRLSDGDHLSRTRKMSPPGTAKSRSP